MNIKEYHDSKRVAGKSSCKYECCGCGACKAVCPTCSINMSADEEGFLYPEIDHDKCVDCGICLNACQYRKQSDYITKLVSPVVYAAKSKDAVSLKMSSSGGIANRLAYYIIDQGGVAVGAVYDTEMKVRHMVIDTKEALNRIQGSKYVQSRIDCIYEDVKKCLKTERPVLFTGTPCQVAGLYHFLGKDFKNLFTVDVICYGVTSPLLFKEYIRWEEKRSKSRVSSINFRDKSTGWTKPCTAIVFENAKKNKRILSNDNVYYRIFLSHNATRLSCFNCLYTNMKRVGDISLGDFWGIEKYNIPYEISQGISKVIVSSEKGKELINNIKDQIDILEMPIESAIRRNLQAPPKENPLRESFFSDFEKKGFEYCVKEYINDKMNVRIKKYIWNILRNIGVIGNR